MPNKMHKSLTIFATFLLWLIASSLLWSNVRSMDDAPLLAEQRQDELEQERLARQHKKKAKQHPVHLLVHLSMM